MRIKLRHITAAFCILVLLLRYEQVLNILSFLFESGGMTLELMDAIFSAFMIIVLLIYSLFSKDRFMNLKASLSSGLLLLMFLSALTAPLCTPFSPDFQKNLGVTKLLPPLSSKYMIITDEQNIPGNIALRKKILKEDIYDNLQIADSISYTGNVYYQGNHIKEVKESFRTGHAFYILGTDELGRDLFTRLIYGTRISLTVGILSVTISLMIGLILGFFSGYYSGFGGALLNRFTDIFLSFPSLFLIILILALFGNSIMSVIIVLGFTGWMTLFKIIRGEVKSLLTKDYFITASSLGIGKRSLIFKEMLPVVIVPVINNLVILFGGVIVAEASLSYIGLGTGMMYPSWGSMIDQGQNYLRSAWWMILMPGLFLFITLFTANNIGKAIQSYFNPRLK